MAQAHVYSGFWNSINHDRKYDADDFNRIFDGIITDGIMRNYKDAFKTTIKSGLTVNMNPGRAFFNHIWTWSDSIIELKCSYADVSKPRKDALILEINSNNLSSDGRKTVFKIITGTPDMALPKPTMIHNENVNQYPLYYIIVRQNSTSISSGDIIDNRGSIECPYSECLKASNGIDLTYGSSSIPSTTLVGFNILNFDPSAGSMATNRLYFTIEN